MNRAVRWLERDYDTYEWEDWDVLVYDGEAVKVFVWRPTDGSHLENGVFVTRLMFDLIEETGGWTDPANTEDEDLDPDDLPF